MTRLSRLDEIIELLQTRDSLFSEPKMVDMVQWMGTLSDEEVVELLRISATELAWRGIGGHGRSVYPSSEVFFEASKQIAKVFYENTKKWGKDDLG